MSTGQTPNFLIVYPAGFQGTWNVGGYCCGAAAAQNINDLKFVTAVLNDLSSVVAFEPQRVYATGFSNGGQFSYYLACNMSDKIAAIASVAGAMQPPFNKCYPTRAVPVMHWAGLADVYDPFAGGKSVVPTAPLQLPAQQGLDLWRTLDGTPVTAPVDIVGSNAQCTESSGSQTNAAVVLCTVQGLGHVAR